MDARGVYAIVNTKNGLRYIGSTISFEQRWAQHKIHLRMGYHENEALQRDWNVDPDSFQFEIVEVLPEGSTRNQLQARERYYINRCGAESGRIYNINNASKYTMRNLGRQDKDGVNILSVKQIAERANVTERAAHSWLVNGKIPAREEKHGTKVWRFATVEDVDVFLATLGGLPQV
jgi:group I intron endonuclease